MWTYFQFRVAVKCQQFSSKASVCISTRLFSLQSHNVWHSPNVPNFTKISAPFYKTQGNKYVHLSIFGLSKLSPNGLLYNLMMQGLYRSSRWEWKMRYIIRQAIKKKTFIPKFLTLSWPQLLLATLELKQQIWWVIQFSLFKYHQFTTNVFSAAR